MTIGLDLRKSVFRCTADAGEGSCRPASADAGQAAGVLEKQAPCLVGMEACAAAHHWGKELQKLGHAVRLMPPNYVKPYPKRQKNDAADAEAICEAVTRPNMRFVEIKTCEQQGTLVPAPGAADADAPARAAIECDPRPYGRVRPGGSGWPQWPSAIDRHPGQADDERVPEVARASGSRWSASSGW